jgi:Domain of unknown function (DUF4920)
LSLAAVVVDGIIIMKRASFLLVVGFFGCIRESATHTTEVRPESAASVHAQAPTHVPEQAVVQPTAPTPSASPTPAANAQHLGQPITVATNTALSAIVQNPSQFANQMVRTEGTVTAVCQAAGCWMQIADAEQHVHVKMHGHSFFIPRTASGHRAVVQGIVVGGNPNGHCEQEAAGATGQQAAARLELDATGVELL